MIFLKFWYSKPIQKVKVALYCSEEQSAIDKRNTADNFSLMWRFIEIPPAFQPVKAEQVLFYFQNLQPLYVVKQNVPAISTSSCESKTKFIEIYR
jgi:hypothetical protein